MSLSWRSLWDVWQEYLWPEPVRYEQVGTVVGKIYGGTVDLGGENQIIGEDARPITPDRVLVYPETGFRGELETIKDDLDEYAIEPSADVENGIEYRLHLKKREDEPDLIEMAIEWGKAPYMYSVAGRLRELGYDD